MPAVALVLGGCLGVLGGACYDQKVKKMFDAMLGHCGKSYKGLLAGHIQGKGTIKIKVKGAKNLKNVDTGFAGDVSDPLVRIKNGSQDFKTKTINNNLNPVWNEEFEFEVDFTKETQDKWIQVSLVDSGFTTETSLGEAKVFIPYLSFEPRKETPYVVELEKGEGATFEFGVTFVPA